MRILIHTDEYYPTAQACSYRMQVMADAFLKQGNEVVVVTSSNNLACGAAEPRQERIIYAPAMQMKKKTTLMRMLNNLSFGISSMLAARKAGEIDVVITTSPPVLSSIPGWVIAKYKRAKLVYDVRDIWPDIALEMGSFAENSIYCRIFRRIARFMYRHADWITTVSPGKVEKIKRHVLSLSGDGQLDKVKLVGNGFDETVEQSPLDQELIQRYALGERFTCVYVGNIGFAQGLGSLLDLAERTKHREVQFLLFGKGAEKKMLERQAGERGLTNVHFCGVLPHEKVFTLLSHAQISFISLKNANMTDSIPTKVYEALGIGCPVLLVAEGDACKIVEEAHMGRCVSPNHIDALPEAFDEMVENYPACVRQRSSARKLMHEKYSRQRISADFALQLHEFLNCK